MQKEFITPFLEKIGEYHDLYIKNDTLQLADVFKKYLKNYEWHSVKFVPPPSLAEQAVLKSKYNENY